MFKCSCQELSLLECLKVLPPCKGYQGCPGGVQHICPLNRSPEENETLSYPFSVLHEKLQINPSPHTQNQRGLWNSLT